MARLGTVRWRHGEAVNALAFSPDGRFIATACGDGLARLWERTTGKERRRFDYAQVSEVKQGGRAIRLHNPQAVRGVAYSGDGMRLAVGAGSVLLLDAATGKEQRRFTPRQEYVNQVVFSPDDKLLASVGHTTIRLWDLAAGKELRQLSGHQDFVRWVAFSPDGTLFASVSQDQNGTVLLWDVATGKRIRTLSCEAEVVLVALAFSPDGKTLAAGGANRRVFTGDAAIYRWDIASGNFMGANGCDNGAHEAKSDGLFGLTIWAWGTEVTGMSGLMMDITDRKNADETIRLHHAQLAHVTRLSTMGEMVAGIMLGPSLFKLLAPDLFGAVFPDSSIPLLNALSQIGVIFFLFLVGLELDPTLLKNRGHVAIVVSHVSSVSATVWSGRLMTRPDSSGQRDLETTKLFSWSMSATTSNSYSMPPRCSGCSPSFTGTLRPRSFSVTSYAVFTRIVTTT